MSCVMDEQLGFVKQIAGRLADAGIDYMLTGSMAMAVYAIPRMTRNVDVVIAVSRDHAETLVRLFEPDCYIDSDTVLEAIDDSGMFTIIHNEWIIRADFVVRKNSPYRKTEFERRRQIEVEVSPLFIVAPEDLILSKLEWARETESELQRRDVRDLIASVSDLDWDYIDKWSVQVGIDWLLREVRE